ncbi:MAG: hypothetical protein ABSE73_00555 [Planctomycetota bacterium]
MHKPRTPTTPTTPVCVRIAAMREAGLMPEPVTTYAEFDEMIRAFDEGLIEFLVLVGSHGLGKTERFLRFKNLAYINNSASARGIYEWAMSNIDKALVLDDLDGLLKVREVIALLKALCETRSIKTVSLTKFLPAGVPRQFQTRSRVCLGFNALPELEADLVALLDRARLVVFAPSAQEVHRHVGEWFQNREVFEFVGLHLGRITVPSIRLYQRIEAFSRQYADWRERATGLLNHDGAAKRAS